MEKEMKRLPDLELEVMLIIWQSDRVLNTGDIHQRLTAGKPRPRQATQMVLSRLEEKAFVRREKARNQNYFNPLVAEDTYKARETATFLEKLYGNSPARLVAALVQDDGISAEDLAEIKRILEREAK
jgi:predicted transcriptional regulator